MAKLDDKYKIGIESIDEQHGEIIKILQDVMLNLKTPKKNKVEPLAATLDSLKTYALKHFDYEEKWMKKEGYPQIEEHLKLHQNYKDHLLELQKDIGSHHEERLKKTALFIREWFLEHILVEDKKFGDFYLKSKKENRGF